MKADVEPIVKEANNNFFILFFSIIVFHYLLIKTIYRQYNGLRVIWRRFHKYEGRNIQLSSVSWTFQIITELSNSTIL